MDRRFLSILALIVLLFVGIFAVSQHASNKSGSTNSSNAQPTNHKEGLGQKNVTLVEYGDFECPICEIYYQPLKQVASQFSQQIYFQFRNLPLTQLHPNAFAGARAAEAASLQGKYWQMHDKLYDNQNEWASASNPTSFFDNYAKSIGLNLTKFDQDYSSSQVNDAINADIAAFGKTGQQMATPTFFLDGKYVDNGQFTDPSTGAPSVNKFAAVINAEISKKNP